MGLAVCWERIRSFLKTKPWMAVLLLLVFIPRLAFIFLIQPPVTWSDARIYDITAWNFAQGHAYSMVPGVPFAGREPGYALFFLAPIYVLFGHSLFAAQIFQTLLGFVTALLLYSLGKGYDSETVARGASLLFALHPTLVAYTGEILTEIAFTFLLFCSVFFLLRGIECESKSQIALSGLFMGLATLTRFYTVLFPIAALILFACLFRFWRKACHYTLLFTFPFVLVVSPWTIRNYLTFGGFILGRIGGGEIIWSGTYVPWRGEWRGRQPPLTELREKYFHGDPIAYDRALLRLAWENVRKDPWGVAWIWLRKPLRIFGGREFFPIEHGDNWLARLLRKVGPSEMTVMSMVRAGNLVIYLFAGVGFVALWRRGRRVFPLAFLIVFGYFLFTHFPLHPETRYRLPLVPYIFLLAAVGFFSARSLGGHSPPGDSQGEGHA